MKIALFGKFGGGNFGNDASLEAVVRWLREDVGGCELVCFCIVPTVIERRFGLQSFELGSPPLAAGWLRAVDRLLFGAVRRANAFAIAYRRCRGVDVLIVPGTGFLDDFGERPLSGPAIQLGWLLAARLAGARVAMVSVGAGPVRRPLSRLLMRYTAGLASYRSFRDDPSRAFIRGLGLDVSGDRVYPDVVMRLPSPASPGEPGDGPLTVGIGVMSYFGWAAKAPDGPAIYRRYIGKIARFVSALDARGYRIRLLIGETEDAQAVEDVLRELGRCASDQAVRRVIAEPAASLHDVMAQLRCCDVVVATRFHNVVCALMLGRPTISLGYADKNAALLRGFGLGAYARHVETFEVDLLMADFETLVANRKAHAAQVLEGIEAARLRLREQDRTLAERFLLSPEARSGPLGTRCAADV